LTRYRKSIKMNWKKEPCLRNVPHRGRIFGRFSKEKFFAATVVHPTGNADGRTEASKILADSDSKISKGSDY